MTENTRAVLALMLLLLVVMTWSHIATRISRIFQSKLLDVGLLGSIIFVCWLLTR
jgi:hypothetical protein